MSVKATYDGVVRLPMSLAAHKQPTSEGRAAKQEQQHALNNLGAAEVDGWIMCQKVSLTNDFHAVVHPYSYTTA